MNAMLFSLSFSILYIKPERGRARGYCLLLCYIKNSITPSIPWKSGSRWIYLHLNLMKIHQFKQNPFLFLSHVQIIQQSRHEHCENVFGSFYCWIFFERVHITFSITNEGNSSLINTTISNPFFMQHMLTLTSLIH